MGTKQPYSTALLSDRRTCKHELSQPQVAAIAERISHASYMILLDE
jgi:hypothetical protein